MGIAHEKDRVYNVKICSDEANIHKCINYDIDIDLYGVLETIAKYDSIETYYDEYFDENLDVVYDGLNTFIFSDNCSLLQTKIRDSSVDIGFDNFKLRVNDNIEKLKLSYQYIGASNGVLRLSMISGEYISIFYSNSKITMIKIHSE